MQQLVEAGLRVFRIGGKRDTTTWGWLTWLVRHWDEMEHIIRTRGSGPWFYVVYERNIAELEDRSAVGQIAVNRTTPSSSTSATSPPSSSRSTCPSTSESVR